MAEQYPRAHFTRRGFLASAVGLSVASVLVSCAPIAPAAPTPAPAAKQAEAPKPTEPPKPAPAAAAKPPAAKVKLTLIHSYVDPAEAVKTAKPGTLDYSNAENWKKARDLFLERNSGVEFEDIFGAWATELRTKQQVAITGGTPPDSLYTEWATEFAGIGFLEPIDLKAMDLAGKILEASLEGYTWKGQVYGIAIWAHALAMGRNRALAKDAGLNPDKHPESWVEWEEFALKITNPAKGIFGTIIPGSGDSYGGQMRYAPFLWGAGGDFFDKEFTKAVWDQPPGISSIEFLSRMSKKTAPPGSASAVRKTNTTAWLAGTIGYFIESMGTFIQAKEAGLDFEVGGFPTSPGGKPSSTLVGNSGWSVAKGAKNKDLAMKWVQHNGSAEIQRIYSGQAQKFPVNKDAWDLPWIKTDQIMGKGFPVFSKGDNHILQTTPVADGEIKKIFELALEEALVGTNPAQVWKDSAAKATALLQKKP